MKRTFLPLAVILAVVCGCSHIEDAAPVVISEKPQETQKLSSIIEGELILKLSEEAAASLESAKATRAVNSFANSLADAGVVTYERIFQDAGEWEPRHREAGLHLWYRIRYDENTQSVAAASESVGDIEGVVSVERSRRIKATAVFNDPYLPSQWNYYNDGSLGSRYAPGADINVVPVWQNYTAGSKNVIVAVIDTGIDMDHPDLEGVCLPTGPDGSKCFLSNYPGYTIYPDVHGTHVAGTIAAINNNGLGVCGVAGGNDGTGGVRIMALQILHTDPEDGKNLQGDEYGAIVWAADHGAVIAQNSWGIDYDTEADAAAGGPGATAAAIDYFNKYAGCDKDGNQRPDSPMKGGVVFFSAGNESWKHAWPAQYEGCIAVGAIGGFFSRASYSNFGDWVDICAPGGDAKTGSNIISTSLDGQYSSLCGTSMACPHVSGVAALIVSYFGGQGFTNEMLLERLLKGANHKVLPGSEIGPLVDALGSFTYGGSVAPEMVDDFSASVKSNKITLVWKVTPDKDDLKTYAYLVKYSKDKSVLEAAAPNEMPAGVSSKTFLSGSVEVGEDISAEISGLEFDTSYYFSIVAYDYSGNYASASPVKSVRTRGNTPPVVTADHSGAIVIKPSAISRTTYRISDPDGHPFEVSFVPGSDAASIMQKDTVCTVEIVGSKAPKGKYSAHLIATDEYGAATDFEIEYEILENHAPRLLKNFDDILSGTVGETRELNMKDYFYDEDDEPLTYSFSVSRQNVAHFLANLDKVTLSTMGYGMVDVTIEARDAVGAVCQASFKVAVRDLSQPVSLFPNPVSTTLNISTSKSVNAEILIVNKVGATVYDASHEISPFSPVAVNMSDCPAGTYYVVIKGGSIDGKYPVVKK